MSSTVTAHGNDGYTFVSIAITAPWPYTTGCEKQFIFNGPSSARSISAWDPSLGGIWATSGAVPRYYPQTSCLPGFLTRTYGNSMFYDVQSLVCPERWELQTTQTTSTSGVYFRPYASYVTCCPPSYSLSCSDKVGATCFSACYSSVSRGQTIVGIPNDYDHQLHTGVYATAYTYTTDPSTFVAPSPTVVQGYMLTGYYPLSYPTSSYYNGGGSSGDGSYDSADAAFNRWLAIRLGVGITIPVVFFIIMGILACVIFRRRKRRTQAHNANGPNAHGYPPNQYNNGPTSSIPGPNGAFIPSKYAGANTNVYPVPGQHPYPQYGPPAPQNQYLGPAPVHDQYVAHRHGPNQYAGGMSGGMAPAQYAETLPTQPSPVSPMTYAASSTTDGYVGGHVNREIQEIPGQQVGAELHNEPIRTPVSAADR